MIKAWNDSGRPQRHSVDWPCTTSRRTCTVAETCFCSTGRALGLIESRALSKTPSLSLRLRLAPSGARRVLFGFCSAFVRYLFGFCSVYEKSSIKGEKGAQFMDNRTMEILESLPKRAPRSRLMLYCDLIMEMRQMGRTFREILQVLYDSCQLRVSISTLHDFVRLQRKARRKASKRQISAYCPPARPIPLVKTPPESGTATRYQINPFQEDLQKRITELKNRAVKSESSPPLFNYDPEQPLHIPSKNDK